VFEIRRKQAGERRKTIGLVLLGGLTVVALVVAVIRFGPEVTAPPPPSEIEARLSDLAPVTGVDVLGGDGWVVRVAPDWVGIGDPDALAALCKEMSARLGRTGTQSIEVNDNDGIRITECQ